MDFNLMNIDTFNQTPGKANCMLFAFGKKMDPSKETFEYNLWGFRSTPIKEIVENAGAEFGGLKLRKINSIEEAPVDQYLIGFYLDKPASEYGEYDYHFIRRELTGEWVEKPDWNRKACKANLDQLRQEFGMAPILFIVEGAL